MCSSHNALHTWLILVLTYIDISAIRIGISPEFSFYYVSIANGSSGIGRLVAGYVGDKVGLYSLNVSLHHLSRLTFYLGPLNYIIPATLISGALTYAWPFATTSTALIVIAVIYGFASGAYVSLFPVPLYELGDIGDIGRRSGMMMTVAAAGALIGPPISGAINHSTGGFESVGYYAGGLYSGIHPVPGSMN